MNKGFKIYVFAWVILLILFNVIAFAFPGWKDTDKYSSTFLIGYIFITAFFVINLVCANYAFKADSAKKLFYNIPLITISYSALIASFVVGGLCMIFPIIPYWVGIVICAAILVLFVLAIIKANTAAELVERVDDNVRSQTSFIRNMTVEAESLMNRATSPEARIACKKVYEAIRYSDPMSNEELSLIEAKITIKFDELSSAVSADDGKVKEIADEILILFANRNNKCKALK